MTKWNTTPLGNARYPHNVTEQQRRDVLSLVLALGGIKDLGVETVDEISARETTDTATANSFADAAIGFAQACWRLMGAEQSGIIHVENWLPVLDNVSYTIHDTDASSASGSVTNTLFAALVMSARDPKSHVSMPDFAIQDRDDAVTAAILLAGAALQFTAARHPHAPRIKPGTVKMPPKVNELAENLATSIDLHLANT